jgi:hypothetical protein
MSVNSTIPAYLTYLIMVLPAAILFFILKVRWSKDKQRAQTVKGVLVIATGFSLIEIVRQFGHMFPKEHLLWSIVVGGTAGMVVTLLSEIKRKD